MCNSRGHTRGDSSSRTVGRFNHLTPYDVTVQTVLYAGITFCTVSSVTNSTNFWQRPHFTNRCIRHETGSTRDLIRGFDERDDRLD